MYNNSLEDRSRKSNPPRGKQSDDPILLQTEELEPATMREVAWRLVPFLCLIYVVAFIDRINIGFAALTMSKDLGLTPAMFGLGAGIFFIGYFLLDVPSNLLTIRGPLYVQFGDYGDDIALRHLVDEVTAWPDIEAAPEPRMAPLHCRPGGRPLGRSIDHRLIPCQVILSLSSKTLKHNSIPENKQK